MQDICYHQIALLNLRSSDVSYALRANYPFYIEQRGPQLGSHLKRAATDGSAREGDLGDTDENVMLGATQGRTYQKGMNAPAFINPSSGPLKASMDLQDSLKAEIRELVNLAVGSLARRSAESKGMDNQGLEAGLSYLGLVLQNGENQIAEFWAAYEEKNANKRDIAAIRYPDQYSLKSEKDRIAEAEALQKVAVAIPGRLIKRELAKSMVGILLNGKATLEKIEEIQDEIDGTPYTTSDPSVIVSAQAGGIIGNQVAGMALGFEDDEYERANADHAERIARIAIAQMPKEVAPVANPAARGVDDLDANVKAGGDEKAAARDGTLNNNTQVAVRGKERPMGPVGGQGNNGGRAGGGNRGGKF